MLDGLHRHQDCLNDWHWHIKWLLSNLVNIDLVRAIHNVLHEDWCLDNNSLNKAWARVADDMLNEDIDG